MSPSRVWFPPLSYSLMALLLRLAAPSAPPRRSSGGRALPRVVLPEAIFSECPLIAPRSVSLFSLHGHSLVNFSRPPFLSFHAGLSNPAIHCSSGQQLPPARVLLWSLSPPNCCAPELLDEMLAIPSLSLSTSVVSVCCTCALVRVSLNVTSGCRSAVVVTVRFLAIAVIGALGTLKSC